MMIRQLTHGNSEHITKWQSVPGRVALVMSSGSLEVNAELALAMAINTLCRVHPVVTSLDVSLSGSTDRILGAPLFDGYDLKSGVTSFIGKLRPLVEARVVDSLNGDYDAVLSIGKTDVEHESKVCVASDGWIAHTGTDQLSTDFTDNFNPVGAYLAANIGSAEIFKRVFVKKADSIIPELGEYDFRHNLRFLDKALKFNSFDYGINNRNGFNPAIPDAVRIGELVVAGVGAGGGSCLYTLASIPQLHGIFHLIDPQVVTLSNLNRYIYAVHCDAEKNRPKVDVMERLLKTPKIIVKTHNLPFGKFSRELNGSPVAMVISTVDTSQTRIEIQWDLPRVLLDAAVVGTEFYVKRVDLESTACLGCMHHGKESSESIENLLSPIIGLSAEIIANLKNNSVPIDESHIEMMRPFSEKYAFELPKAGEHFQDWHLYHCGEIPLDGQKEIQIPVPFATVMPGILLAGEVIKQRHFSDYAVRDYFSYNIFGEPRDIVETLNKRQNCPICSNAMTLERYREKHNLQRT